MEMTPVKTFFISDTHFGHRNLLKLANTPAQVLERARAAA